MAWQTMTAANAAVAGAAVAVLIEAAEREATEIREAESQLANRRARLDGLCRAATDFDRGRGVLTRPVFGQVVFEVVGNRPSAGTDDIAYWSTVLRDLVDSASAHSVSVAPLAEQAAPEVEPQTE
jgi:hypothetical protein